MYDKIATLLSSRELVDLAICTFSKIKWKWLVVSVGFIHIELIKSMNKSLWLNNNYIGTIGTFFWEMLCKVTLFDRFPANRDNNYESTIRRMIDIIEQLNKNKLLLQTLSASWLKQINHLNQNIVHWSASPRDLC